SAPPSAEPSPLSLHDALPILSPRMVNFPPTTVGDGLSAGPGWISFSIKVPAVVPSVIQGSVPYSALSPWNRTLLPKVITLSGLRSEEHTSELQSRENLVCRLL